MTDTKNIDGHFYPLPHPGWGGFAEELFHYTSRYYKTTEVFLRSLGGSEDFEMAGYSAARLAPGQRQAMAAILACPPDTGSARALITLVEAVQAGSDAVAAEIAARYPPPLADHPSPDTVEPQVHFESAGLDEVDPLDPFMSLAERLLMPVAVRDRHVEVSLHHLARHLQSPNSTLRTNLHNAVIVLHSHGYVLRNHPDLTHDEAHAITLDGC